MQLNQFSQNHFAERRDNAQGAVETPVKKSRAGLNSDFNTAEETPNAQLSASKRSIAEVDAEELFNNFSRIVTVSESEEAFEEAELSRQLTFEDERSRLDFDQPSSTMRKKRRSSRLFTEQEGQCINIRPFTLSDDNDPQPAKRTEEEIEPVLRRRNSRTTAKTPTKKSHPDCAQFERAARKEEPFRDLKPKRLYS